MGARLRPSRTTVLLGLVLLLGLAARVPGVFWGYRFFGTELVYLNPDEPVYTAGRAPGTAFPRGLAVNIRLLTLGLGAIGLGGLTRAPEYEFLVGRIVSLVYGLLTLVVLFRLARAFFRDERIALVAAFFLALADLHVTYSHLGIPDSAATFWFYAGLTAAHTALARGSRAAFLASAACVGVTGALRFQFVGLVPLVWWVARSRRRLGHAALLVGATGLAFFLADGLAFNLWATRRVLAFVVTWGDLGWKKLFLPLVYLGVLLVGVGLPMFLLALYGGVRLIRAKWPVLTDRRALLADPQLPVCLAPLAAFLQLSTVGLWAPRHAVVLAPFTAMLAAYGFAGLARAAAARAPAVLTPGRLLAVIGLYLAVHVGSVQAHFVDDPLEQAGRWLRAHVPAGETISALAKLPPEYRKTTDWRANYLVLSAQEYRRYLFKDFLRGDLTGRFPGIGEFWGGDPERAVRFHQLRRGELPYRVVKKVKLRLYTPELLLTQAFWYPPPHLNEVVIYERRREREHRAEVLTPVLTDYLLTLDTGQLWRPDPDQQVQVELNGHRLATPLQAGINHLVLPRGVVAAPRSELTLRSDRPLPHLPPNPVVRVRPIAEAFAVESLLDDDLLPEGFHPVEIGADGAVWRWSQAVGRVLLPGPGTGPPWRRLAVRLRGRPTGAGPPQPVVFFLDGRKIGDAALTGKEELVDLALAPGAVPMDLASLEIVTRPGRPGAAAGDDARPRGVAVSWVRLDRGARPARAETTATTAALAGPGWRPLFGLAPGFRLETVSFPSGRLTLRADLLVPDGPARSAILLAHGASVRGRRHGLYAGLARRLAEKGYVVLNPDFRGYGESEDPARVATAADLDFTQDLVAAIGFLERRLGPRDVMVVGHSFGAGVALAAAARDPRVDKVVAISPGRRAHERILGSAEGRTLIRDRMAAEMGLREEQFPVELVEAVVTPIVIDTYVGHRFRQPILLVDGEREEEADLRFLRERFERMRGPRAYVTIPGADHYFGVARQVEERDPVTLQTLADVIDGWIRDGARWARRED